MRQLRHQKEAAAFTLIEIMITMAIMVIIVTVGLTSFRQADKSSAHTFAAQALVSDLRLAAGKALAGERFQVQAVPGWGISFTNNENYIVYADLDGDKRYNDTVIDYKEKYSLETPDPNTIFAYTGDIYFDANGHVYENGTVLPLGGDLAIPVNKKDGTAITIIHINSSAAVSNE